MEKWFGFAIAAAVLYGLHQVFTKMAADRIGDGVGAFVVEGTAALTVLVYLGWLWSAGDWNQPLTPDGAAYSALTGICVGIGTVAFFLMFQHGGPLSAVPAILAAGAAMMAVAGVLFFRESLSVQRAMGIVLSIVGLYLLRK